MIENLLLSLLRSLKIVLKMLCSCLEFSRRRIQNLCFFSSFYLLVHYHKKDNFLFKLHFKPEAELGNEDLLLKRTEAPQTHSWKMVQFNCVSGCGATNIFMGKGPYMLTCYQCHARQSSLHTQRIS
jgi:hypothetical protein